MKITDHFLTKETFEIINTETPGVYKTSPVPDNISKYYDSDEYISHHQDSGSIKEKIYKLLQKFNLNYKRNILASELFTKAKVLDYGCGAGEFVKFIEEDFTTFGYEPNEGARSAAKSKTESTIFVDSLDEFSEDSFDAITLWHVFEHIDNQKDTLDKFHKLLKTNGLLIIAVPNPTSFDALYYQEYWAAYDVPRHIYHFTKKGMEKLMNNEKWKIKKIKPLLLDSYYISILSEKYKKNPFSWIKGPVVGAISNIKASKNGEFSSLIYVIKKN